MQSAPKFGSCAGLTHACLRALTQVDTGVQEENAQKIAKHLFYALETYQIVLQKDSGTTVSMSLEYDLATPLWSALCTRSFSFTDT